MPISVTSSMRIWVDGIRRREVSPLFCPFAAAAFFSLCNWRDRDGRLILPSHFYLHHPCWADAKLRSGEQNVIASTFSEQYQQFSTKRHENPRNKRKTLFFMFVIKYTNLYLLFQVSFFPKNTTVVFIC